MFQKSPNLKNKLNPCQLRRRVFVFFISFSLTCLFAGCHSKFKTPQDTLVIGLEASPLTLDPRKAVDAYSSKVSRLVHSGLFKTSARLEIVPDLVERYELTPPLVYRFQIRDGVFFSDGKKLSAEDIKYTFESILDPALASPFRGTFEKIREIKVVDPLTIEISLKEPFAPFLSALTMGIVAIGADPMVGTGPFVVERFMPSEGVWLRKNEKYYEKVPRINALQFRMIPDDNLRILELKNHRIDLLQNNVPPALLGILKNQKDLVFEKTEGINESYLGLNLRAGPLQKKEVRQAMAYALDLRSLINYRMGQMAKPATGLLAPIHWAYEPTVTTYPYNPKKARQLLDEAGYPDPDAQGPDFRFSLTYKTSTKRDRIGLARLVARYLGDVGIDVKILPFEWGTLFEDLTKGNFELYSLTWVGITEPDIYYYAFHSSQRPPVGANRGGYQNTTIDRLTEQGQKEEDLPKRKLIYSEVQKILSQELPMIPLWYEDNFAVFSNRVKGVQLRPDGSFEWVTSVWKEQ